jgi:hypothetical protein
MSNPIPSESALPDTHPSQTENAHSIDRPISFAPSRQSWLSRALGRVALRLSRSGLWRRSWLVALLMTERLAVSLVFFAVSAHHMSTVLGVIGHLTPSNATTEEVISLPIPSNARIRHAKERDAENPEDNRRHDSGHDGRTGGREGNQEDSNGSRSGEDNRERILQDEIGDLRKRVDRLYILVIILSVVLALLSLRLALGGLS